MGYVTREFAHLETLERARRWLIEVGFDPARIEVHTHGVLRITVAVQSGQADEAERILDAVTASDPDGPPSFWDHADPHHQHHPGGATQATTTPPVPGGGLPSDTFDIAWRPRDPEREVTQTSTEVEKQKLYREGRD